MDKQGGAEHITCLKIRQNWLKNRQLERRGLKSRNWWGISRLRKNAQKPLEGEKAEPVKNYSRIRHEISHNPPRTSLLKAIHLGSPPKNRAITRPDSLESGL